MSATRTARLAVATLLVVMLLGGTAAGMVFPSPNNVTVTGISTSDATAESNPTIDGKLIAYEFGDHIRVHNLSTGTSRVVPNTGGVQQRPDVSGDWVVYEDNSAGNWDIRVYSWSQDAVFDVETSAHNERNPRIDGLTVVWQADETDFLWFRDYDPQHAGTYQLTNWGNFYLFDVDNDRIAVSDGSKLYIATLHVVGGSEPFAWIGPVEFGATTTVKALSLHGPRVALDLESGGDHDIKAYDYRIGGLSNIATSDTESERSPSVFHDSYAWTYGPPLDPEVNWLVPGYLTLFTHVDSESHGDPSVFGRRIAFTRAVFLGDADVMLGTGVKLSKRTAGTDRYATAAEVSKAYFSKAKNVVLCTGENFPDALAAAPLARALDAPLLLTRKDSIPAATLTEITRLGPTKIWVIGGTGTISSAVKGQLESAGYATERIAGADRYETSAKIGLKLKEKLGTAFRGRAFFARGDNFPDALAVGPVAASIYAPVLLVKPTALPSTVASAITSLGIQNGTVVGDTSSVSNDVKNAIDALCPGTIGRLGGSDRYATARLVVNFGLAAQTIDLDTLGIAVGTKFPDALAAGAALGAYGSPIMLTAGTSLSASTASFLDAHAWDIGRLDVFGSTDSVSNAVMTAILDKIK